MLNISDINKNKLAVGGISLVIFTIIILMNAASLQAQSSSTGNESEVLVITGNSEILMRDGKFSIVEHVTPLNQILRELSNVSGIEIQWQGAEIDRSVSAGMTDRTIDEALSHLLKGVNYLVSFGPSHNGEVKRKVVILPDGSLSDSKTNITQPITENRSHLVANDNTRELSPTEEEGLRRYDDLVEIEKISRMKDKKKATEKLSSLLASHSDPIVRLNALTSLNDISSLDEQTLIQTVSNESDPRVKIQAIEYLTERLDENPDIEKFLSMKLEVN